MEVKDRMKTQILALFAASWLIATSELQAMDRGTWVERLAFWASTELKFLRDELQAVERELQVLPAAAGSNSGIRLGFQSAGTTAGQVLWVEVELPEALPMDRVVLVPLLAKGTKRAVPGFGFPKRFILEGEDADGVKFELLDCSVADYPNPGIYPVSAACPAGVLLKRVRLTATQPWEEGGPPVLALAEMMLLKGNRNWAQRAEVRSSSSREIPPSWGRNNLVDMATPLGLPLQPGGEKVMGWHGMVSASIGKKQSVTVDLGRVLPLEEIRLAPAWRSRMGWDAYYGFPTRFLVELSEDASFKHAVVVHDRRAISLLSPGQNFQCYGLNQVSGRYIRVTATRLRERTGDYVFALGELQAYSGGVNVALGALAESEHSLEDEEWNLRGLTDGLTAGGVLLELPDWIRKLEYRRRLELRRDEMAGRRAQLYVSAEHRLVGASVFGASGIVVMAGLFSWRGHRARVLDRERHRERLARDLHDELGSNLGSIALISSFAGQEDAAQMRLDLAEIERVARESADSMRDMVSLLGGKRGGVAADWLNVMAGLAGRLLRGVELECELPTSPLKWEPNLETRRELYLFCKEVLHNTAKHAGATRLKFHLSPLPSGLRIEISDDGCGFTPGRVVSGHGLGNLRERAAMMRAELQLDSEPGRGTTVILEVPKSRRWTKRD
jgi:signal transduction histidine kinase